MQISFMMENLAKCSSITLRWSTGIKDLAYAAMADWKEQHKLTRAQKVQRKARKVHDSEGFQSFFGRGRESVRTCTRVQ
jgi:hypothetical protein